VILDNTRYFHFVAVAMSNTFSELGINHTVARTVPAAANAAANATVNDIFITFMAHDVRSGLPQHYISFNFEQLTTDKAWPEEFWRRLR
jgi:hypothetical protein